MISELDLSKGTTFVISISTFIQERKKSVMYRYHEPVVAYSCIQRNNWQYKIK